MTQGDVRDVLEVDRESYPMPWPASAYRRELNNRQHARYIVLRQVRDSEDDETAEPQSAGIQRSWLPRLPWPRSHGGEEPPRAGTIIGYAGMWLVADEAHITTVAVRTSLRGKGLGELLLASMIEIAHDLGSRWVTLEVRMSNEVAQRLYEKYGFRRAGLRKRYYSDNNEDALIMTTDDIGLNAYQVQFAQLRETLAQRLRSEPSVDADAPVLG